MKTNDMGEEDELVFGGNSEAPEELSKIKRHLQISGYQVRQLIECFT